MHRRPSGRWCVHASCPICLANSGVALMAHATRIQITAKRDGHTGHTPSTFRPPCRVLALQRGSVLHLEPSWRGPSCLFVSLVSRMLCVVLLAHTLSRGKFPLARPLAVRALMATVESASRAGRCRVRGRALACYFYNERCYVDPRCDTSEAHITPLLWEKPRKAATPF